MYALGLYVCFNALFWITSSQYVLNDHVSKNDVSVSAQNKEFIQRWAISIENCPGSQNSLLKEEPMMPNPPELAAF